MIPHRTTQSGFSLVETLVAITVLLVIIVGPMTLVSSSARSTNFASEQVVAFFLAQEGAELAQKARDDYVLGRFRQSSPVADPWEDFTRTQTPGAISPYASCFTAGANGGCGLQVSNANDGAITAVACGTGGSLCRLRLDTRANESGVSTTGRARYTYSTSAQLTTTPFTRRVYFVRNGDQIRVTSEVLWYTGSLTTQQQTVVETYLYDIYGN